MANDEPKSDQPKPDAPAAEPATPPAAGDPATPPAADPNAAATDPAADPATTGGPPPNGVTLSVAKGDNKKNTGGKHRASLGSLYRRADITTTLITFIAALIVGVLAVGTYWYLTRVKPAAAPKVTTLDKADLDKLGAFFEGNAAGTTSQVLSISPSTVFKNRVAVTSDLKVTGGLEVTGGSALADLTVDKVSTLGVTNIRGSLTVAGPASFTSAVQLGAGGSINGNLAVTGNGSFGGSLSAGILNVRDISVSGTLNLAGHLSITGQTPSIAPQQAAGSGASTSVEGNDSSGSVSLNTGNIPGQSIPTGGLLATITFKSAYPRTPHIVISPVGQNAATLQFYVLKTASGFIIGSNNPAASNTNYAFDYWVVQ